MNVTDPILRVSVGARLREETLRGTGTTARSAEKDF
jgi:hypothetical protein